MKVAFLDRDGTIIRDYNDEDWRYVTEPEFLPGAIDALQQFLYKGYHLIIITNQYLIDEGIITHAQYHAISQKMCSTLLEHHVKILDIFYCADSRQKKNSCLKPSPGMIEKALKEYPNIELYQSFLAGDSQCDIELARRVGLKAFGIGYADGGQPDYIPVTSLRDVCEFV